MTKGASAIAVVVLLFGIGVVAQQPEGSRPPQQSGQRQQSGQGQMSMDNMMKGCLEHCEPSMKAMDALARTIGDAKAKDPAKMRAALEQAEKPLADVRQHMTMC